MDARDRLRRYLEQRREVGETELILDGMPVEDLLALIGAKSNAAPRRAAASAASAASDAPPPAPSDAAKVERGVPQHTASAEPVAPPPVEPPAPPTPRFEGTGSTDWRQALRSAGAAPDAVVRPDSAAPSPASRPLDAPGASPRAAAPATEASAEPWPAWLTALDLPTGITVSAASLQLPAALASLDLAGVAEQVAACTACALHERARHPVPGHGNPAAEFVCVGEGPGEQEDAQGLPFVGPSGDLLTKMLAGIQIQRTDVFIGNVVKHRPPANRDPQPAEVAACLPYLHRQLQILRPRVILALGRSAAQALLATDTGLGRLRGQIHRYQGIPVIVTYHPAALLRNEEWKRPAWQDLKLARRVLDAARAAAPLASS